MVQIIRLIHIIRLFFQLGLDEFLPNHYRKRSKILKILLLCRKKYPSHNLGFRLKYGCERLGPVWIKFGQMLSTRRDLFDAVIADELAALQDRVTPFATELFKALVEHNLGRNIDEVFTSFDDKPLGSASIAQVHKAVLRENNQQVIIKLLRPKVHQAVQKDVQLMRFMVQNLTIIIPLIQRLRLGEVLDEFEQQLADELDLRKEATNTQRLRSHFHHSPDLYVPKIYDRYVFANMMVGEYIEALAIGDIPNLTTRGVNLKVLAEKGVRVFFTQVFRDNFFHADMHAGNIFVNAQNPEDPQYIAIDCAIMGHLNHDDKRYLAENFLAFFNRDYLKVARLHIESGWIDDEVDPLLCAKAFEKVCDPMFQKPLGEISFGILLLKLFDVAREFKMQVQPQLVLLQKTLLYIEGLGRTLYPELDLWKTARPFLQNWLNEQRGVRGIVKELKQQLPNGTADLPAFAHDCISLVSEHKRLKREVKKLRAELKLLQQHKSPSHTPYYLLFSLVLAVIILL